jgi:hypothetical protein
MYIHDKVIPSSGRVFLRGTTLIALVLPQRQPSRLKPRFCLRLDSLADCHSDILLRISGDTGNELVYTADAGLQRFPLDTGRRPRQDDHGKILKGG